MRIQVGEIIDDVIREGLPSHGESNESALSWVPTDPNNVDSDGDTLPDGWEARYTCSWNKDNKGINPLNGSDALNNPDGDGYDINMDGVLSIDEQLVNWLEYHLKDQIIYNDATESGMEFPNGFVHKPVTLFMAGTRLRAPLVSTLVQHTSAWSMELL